MPKKYNEAIREGENRKQIWAKTHYLKEFVGEDLINRVVNIYNELRYAYAWAVKEKFKLDPMNLKIVPMREFMNLAQAGVPYNEIMKKPGIRKELSGLNPKQMHFVYDACKVDAAHQEENAEIFSAFFKHLKQDETHDLSPRARKEAEQLKNKALYLCKNGTMGRSFQILMTNPKISKEEKEELHKLYVQNDDQSNQELFRRYIRELSRIPETFLNPHPSDDLWTNDQFMYYIQLASDYEYTRRNMNNFPLTEEESANLKILTGYMNTINFARNSEINAVLCGKPCPESFENMTMDDVPKVYEEYPDNPHAANCAGQHALLTKEAHKEAADALKFLKQHYLPEAEAEKP